VSRGSKSGQAVTGTNVTPYEQEPVEGDDPWGKDNGNKQKRGKRIKSKGKSPRQRNGQSLELGGEGLKSEKGNTPLVTEKNCLTT